MEILNLGNEIRATYNGKTIQVYQAYNEQIANELLELETFGSSFSMNRMTWTKPSFLWMMYRSGWASKENQTRIIAFNITIRGFNELLKKSS